MSQESEDTRHVSNQLTDTGHAAQLVAEAVKDLKVGLLNQSLRKLEQALKLLPSLGKAD